MRQSWQSSQLAWYTGNEIRAIEPPQQKSIELTKVFCLKHELTLCRRQLQTTHLIMYRERGIKDSGAYVQLWGRRMSCRDWSCRWSLQRPPGACPWRSASASSPPPRSPRAPPPRWSSCHLGTWAKYRSCQVTVYLLFWPWHVSIVRLHVDLKLAAVVLHHILALQLGREGVGILWQNIIFSSSVLRPHL